MALRNTSERYEYIYGSNVRKLETDTAGKQTAKAVPAKKNVRRPEQRRTGNKAADSEAAAAIQKNAAKFLAFDWKYTLIAVIAAAIAASEGTSTDGFVVRSIRKINRKKNKSEYGGIVYAKNEST